jgi:hypothetical protein
VVTQPDFIVKGWTHVGLIRASIPDFQFEYVEKNTTTFLFKPTLVELKNKKLIAALDVNFTVGSNSDIEEDFRSCKSLY